MEQRRAPWSHWPNFSPRNTILLVCEKRGAWVCVCVCLWFFVLSQATRPGLDHVWLLVQFSLLRLYSNLARVAVQSVPISTVMIHCCTPILLDTVE